MILSLSNGKKVELKDVKFETEEADGITYLKWDFKVYGIKKDQRQAEIRQKEANEIKAAVLPFVSGGG